MKKTKNILTFFLGLLSLVCLLVGVSTSGLLKTDRGNPWTVSLTAYANEGYQYATFNEPLVKGEGATATFDVKDVSVTGVYAVSLKFGDGGVPNVTENSGMVNQKYPSVKSFTNGVGAVLDDDGYASYVYNVYLEAGNNTLVLYMASAAEIVGVRIELIDAVDGIAVTSTAGQSTVISGMLYGIRLTQAAQGALKTAAAELVIAEDGWYDLSYFGSAANQGEIYFTLTDEIGQTIEMCSINLTWTHYGWIRDGIANGNSSYVRCMYTDNSYVVNSENPKDSMESPYVRLSKGTYKVVAYAEKFRPVGDNCQVYYGGAAFVSKVDEQGEQHDYQVKSVTPATCEQGEATTYECTVCGDIFTKKTADALSHDYQVQGSVSADGSAYMKCSRASECGDTGYYAADCGEGLAVVNDTSVNNFNVTVDKAGLYRVYFKFNGLSSASTQLMCVRNTAYATITGGVNMSANADYDGYNSYCVTVYLEQGANELALYLKADTTVEAIRIEYFADVDAVAASSAAGTSNFISGYCTVPLLVQGNRNPQTITATLEIVESGTYDLSYFAGSANDGNIEVTLTNGVKTIALKSTGLAAETSAWVSNNQTLDYTCLLLSHNLYAYNGVSGNLSNAHLVDLEAGAYQVEIKGDTPNGKRQVWFGGGLFATKVNAVCAHNLQCVEFQTATCQVDGFNRYACSNCGYFYEETTTVGHSYSQQSLAEGGALTCTVCGVQEIAFATSPTTNKSAGVATNAMTVTVETAGVYEVYLDYDYVKQTTGKQDVGALVNKTLYPTYNSASGHLKNNMVGFIYSVNYLTNEATQALGYISTTGKGYNGNYFNVYLQSGANELVLHSNYSDNASYSVTIRGAKLILVEQTEGYVVTNHYGATHSGTDLGSNVGFNLNYISNSNHSAQKEDSATITLTGGTYDLTYLAAGHTSHTDNELKITLTKGDTEIVMTSNKICGNANTSFNNAAGKMLLSDNLYVYENGALTNTHLVDLESGEWTVKVFCTNTTSQRGLIFGGLFFTNVSAN